MQYCHTITAFPGKWWRGINNFETKSNTAGWETVNQFLIFPPEAQLAYLQGK